MFGLTTREWYLVGIGQAVQGALIGAFLHSAFILTLDIACLAFGLYMIPPAKPEE